MTESWQPDRKQNTGESPGAPRSVRAKGYKRQTLVGEAASRHLVAPTARQGQSALMRAARRDSFRETVFLWSTPLVIARCSSVCADRRADLAASLSPLVIAASTFLTKV